MDAKDGIDVGLPAVQGTAPVGPRYLRYNSMFVFYLLWDVLRAWAWEKVRRKPSEVRVQ